MESISWGFIGTLIGVFVGASVSIITTIITLRNTKRLQDEADKLEMIKQRKLFQKETLLELQEMIIIHMNNTASARLEDMEHFRTKKAEYNPPLVSKELDEKLSHSSQKLTVLTERITDNELRGVLNRFRSDCTNLLQCKNIKDNSELLNNAVMTFEDTMKPVGEALRNTY